MPSPTDVALPRLPVVAADAWERIDRFPQVHVAAPATDTTRTGEHR